MIENDKPIIIAGPCSIESKEQLTEVIDALSNISQVSMVRCGVWKPRTRPGGFEGIGEPALQWTKDLKDCRNMKFCCEVAKPEHVELCLKYDIDTVWIGARTTGNPFMVEELCEAMKGSKLRVMVKNPTSPDIRLWMGAIERLQQAEIDNISAIHRGFSMYDNIGYRNTPLWELPLELRRQMPQLKLICDPSHIGGKRELIEPIAQSAMQLGFDGLMIEVHPHPADALTDANQQLTPSELQQLLSSLTPIKHTQEGNSNIKLEPLRHQIDDIDYEMIRLLAQRMKVSRAIATIKHENQMSVYQSKRWEEVLSDRIAFAKTYGLSEDFVRELLKKIHGESVRVQMK